MQKSYFNIKVQLGVFILAYKLSLLADWQNIQLDTLYYLMPNMLVGYNAAAQFERGLLGSENVNLICLV